MFSMAARRRQSAMDHDEADGEGTERFIEEDNVFIKVDLVRDRISEPCFRFPWASSGLARLFAGFAGVSMDFRTQTTLGTYLESSSRFSIGESFPRSKQL